MEILYWILCLDVLAGLICLACLLLCVRTGLENIGCVAPAVGTFLGVLLGSWEFIRGWTGPDPVAVLIFAPVGALCGGILAGAVTSLILLARAPGRPPE